MNSRLNKLFNTTYLTELLVIIFFTTLIFIISGHFETAETIYKWLEAYDSYDLDELLMVSPIWVFLMIAVFIISFRRYNELSQTNKELTMKNIALNQAINEIKQLQGIIPICSTCKKIRDDEGYWNQVEKYVTDHSEAKFSHGICPDCARKHYNYIPLPGDDKPQEDS